MKSYGLECGSDTCRSSGYSGTMRTNANTQNGGIEKAGRAKVLDDTLGLLSQSCTAYPRFLSAHNKYTFYLSKPL